MAHKPQIGLISGSTLGSTGNKSITGIGFKPRFVEFFTVPNNGANVGLNTCQGVANDSSQRVTLYSSGASANAYASPSYCLGWITSASATSTPNCLASMVSLDSDGFTINVATASSSVSFAFVAHP